MTAFVTANGLEIGYEVHGAGPPMVLLHGASSAGREDYAAQIPLFSQAFRVHLPDARGHATTRWDPSAGLSQDDLVTDLLGFADALRLATFHLVGFSLGAMTALRFAIGHAERLRTLVVIGVSTEREPRTSVARRILDPRRIERDDPSWALELNRRHDASQGRGSWQRLLDAVVANVADQPEITPGDLRRVELPALVVCGDRDPFTPVGQAWGLARQLPDARLFVAPGCGHDVMVRRPALFNEALGSFYRSTAEVARQRAETGVAAGRVRSGGLGGSAELVRSAGLAASAGIPGSAGLAASAGIPGSAGRGHAGREAGPPDGSPVDPVLADDTLAHPAVASGAETDGEWLAHTGEATNGA